MIKKGLIPKIVRTSSVTLTAMQLCALFATVVTAGVALCAAALISAPFLIVLAAWRICQEALKP